MKLNKIYFYFWFSALVIFSFGLFTEKSNSIFDINIHNTFYIGKYIFSTFFSICLIIIGTIYFVTEKLKIKINYLKAKTHFLVTISGIVIYWIINFYFKISGISENDNLTRNVISTLLLFLNIFYQFMYLISIIFEKRNRIENETGKTL